MADSLSGVVMTNGVPAPARITIVDVSDNSIVASINNNASTGAWTVSLIPAGRYEVIVFRSGYRAAVEGPFDLDGISAELQPFRYWQIHITANNGGPFTSLNEIELRLTTSGPDQTSNSPSSVSASSDYFGANGSRAFNNNTADTQAWVSSSGSFPQWVRYDFGAGNEKTIRELALWAESVNSYNRAPKDFTVQGSADGSSWVTVNTFTGITGWTSGFRTFSVQ